MFEVSVNLDFGSVDKGVDYCRNTQEWYGFARISMIIETLFNGELLNSYSASFNVNVPESDLEHSCSMDVTVYDNNAEDYVELPSSFMSYIEEKVIEQYKEQLVSLIDDIQEEINFYES